MEQQINLSLGSGSLNQGFQSVTLQLWTASQTRPLKFCGSLPPAIEFLELYRRWKVIYQALHMPLELRVSFQSGADVVLSQAANNAPNRDAAAQVGIEFESQNRVNQVSRTEFDQLSQQLKVALNTWLQSTTFSTLEQRLRLRIDPRASIKIIIETDDQHLRHLPWHHWDLLEHCPQAEIAFSAQDYERVELIDRGGAQLPQEKVRILAILGHSQGIDVQQDRSLLEQLPHGDVIFLSEPTRPELDRWLWDKQGWDMVFFAGHSISQANSGRLYLNPDESITVDQLRNALKAAIAQGLKLAIFNSCDGLGLAQALESLNLPQLIVMREPVPDRVAQVFLQNLLQALAGGLEFYPAMRQAREQLQGLEGDFPCASWLPTLCQNPAVPAFVWPRDSSTVAAQAVDEEEREEKTDLRLAPNPYQGLAAFLAPDGDRYFGREQEIQWLWEQQRQLHKDPNAIRLLPIYGPSGSGKSSLARAGLLAKLQQETRQAEFSCQIVTFFPGTHPLWSLAKALVQIVEQDRAPVRKIRELTEELGLKNAAGQYDGLQRITQTLIDPETTSLVLLIDQFEEIYSLCRESEERDILVANLLYAAQHHSQDVSVILTFRSDFLGETHQNPPLNRLFSQQGFLVPAMGKDSLREAIVQPALQVGHALDDATVDLLIEQTEGRDGALPLLQFALTQIWEGLAQGKLSSQVLQEIGGVGGALAGEAERIYQDLNRRQRAIARRLFLSLVQLGEGTRDTRRRAPVETLIAAQDEPTEVRQVINQFAAPSVRLVTLSTVAEQEMVEVTHESLFEHWQQLHQWLDKGRDDLRFQRRLDEAAKDWAAQQRANGLLWRQPSLDLLRSYYRRAGADMTPLQMDFFEASKQAEEQQRQLSRIAVGLLAMLTAGTTWFGVVAHRSATTANRAEKVALGRRFIVQSEQLTGQDGISPKEAGALLGLKALQTFQQLDVEPPTDISHALYKSLILPSIVLATPAEAWANGLAFSSDGRQVVIFSEDNMARLWEISTQQVLAEFPHPEAIQSIAFSPDSSQIVTASEDGLARLWDVETQAVLAEFAHGDAVNQVLFSPDGRRIVTASDDQTVQLWDVKSNASLATLTHAGAVKAIALSADGRQIATASLNQPLQLWDLQQNKVTGTLEHDGAINAIVFSADDSRLATASVDGMVRLWQVQTQSVVASFPLDGAALSVSLSGDGSKIAMASSEGTTQVWDVATQQLITALPHDTWVNQVVFGPGDAVIATASFDGTARIWDLQAWQAELRLSHDSSLGGLALSPDNRQLVTVSSDNLARLWDLQTGRVLQTFAHDDNLWGVVFSPDGDRIATASMDQTAKIWDAASGAELVSFAHNAGVFDLDFSPDASQLVTSSADGQVQLWDLVTGQVQRSFSHGGPVFGVTFSPQGDRIATGGVANQAHLWDAKTGESILTLPHSDAVIDVAFNSDGSQLATAGADALGLVWDTTTGEQVSMVRHEDTVLGVDFSADDTKLATASDDGTVKVTELSTGKTLTSLPHGGQVIEPVFSDDGTQLFTASFDQQARIWSYRSAEALALEVCERLSRNLTVREWQRYIETPLEQYALICETLPVHPSLLAEVERLQEEGDRNTAQAIVRRVEALTEPVAETD